MEAAVCGVIACIYCSVHGTLGRGWIFPRIGPPLRMDEEEPQRSDALRNGGAISRSETK